jgi:hypothetical protein
MESSASRRNSRSMLTLLPSFLMRSPFYFRAGQPERRRRQREDSELLLKIEIDRAIARRVDIGDIRRDQSLAGCQNVHVFAQRLCNLSDHSA